MTALATRLATHLSSREHVVESFRLAHLRLMYHLLPPLDGKPEVSEPEWSTLLSWASVFMQSDHADHVERALAAAVAALLTAPRELDAAHLAASLVLESGSNLPSVALAHSQEELDALGALSVSAILHRHRRRLTHVVIDEALSVALPVTDFQEQVWESVDSTLHTALSAPTSAGKSFILERWLSQAIQTVPANTVYAYLVPSRALIGQVSQDLADSLHFYSSRPRIISIPTLYHGRETRATILVMTQERAERFVTANPASQVDALFVDEAHKLGAGSRGVILQRVIDRVLTKNPYCKLIVAAPHARNPEILLPSPNDREFRIVSDGRPTVLQNLLWVTPVKYRGGLWQLELIDSAGPVILGTLLLASRPVSKQKRFAALAVALGSGGANIVYTNGPGEAETMAGLIRELLSSGAAPVRAHPEALELAALARAQIHPDYPLVETLPFGVGIHYGDMPEVARREQERLFNQGKLQYLVCTSTLLEGVNLPCRNLFVWGPKLGRGQPMDPHAFWNLAGRAGRWGREFAGNIFCLDVHNQEQWPNGPPMLRSAQKVDHAGSRVLREVADFREFVGSSNPSEASRENRYYEQVLGELVLAWLRSGRLNEVSWIGRATSDQVAELETAVRAAADRVTAPVELLSAHSSINPILVSQFFAYLQQMSSSSAEELVPMSPDFPNAQQVLRSNMALTDMHLGSDFGNSSQIALKANITVSWIRGVPLGRIIRDRLEYLRSRARSVKVPAEIRAVIKLINDNARFLVPKYLGCYAACVAEWYRQIGREDLRREIRDLQDMLEAGVAERTTLILIGLGLSRTAAVEIAQHLPDAEMTIDAVVDWLRTRNLTAYNLSPVLIREVDRILELTEFTT